MRNLIQNLTALLLFLATYATLSGAEILVTTAADNGPGSFREAVLNAQSDDTVRFSQPFRIPFDTVVVVDKDLIILGTEGVVFDGNYQTRLLEILRNRRVTIRAVKFVRGNAFGNVRPGALFASGGALKNFGFLALYDCIFENNLAGYGGAIENFSRFRTSALLRIERCLFRNNRASDSIPNPNEILHVGGAITSNSQEEGFAQVVAINSIFTQNSAVDQGGAIHVAVVPSSRDTAAANLICIHSTIAENESDEGGGVNMTQFGISSHQNSIFANNTATNIPNHFGNLTSQGGNIVGRIDTSRQNTKISYTPGPGDRLNIDPMLGPLGDYGGPFPTLPLRCGSPAIDVGVASNVTVDARGFARDAQPDAGAYERRPVLDRRITNLENTGVGSLRAALINACPDDTLSLAGQRGFLNLTEEITLTQDQTIWGDSVNSVVLRARGAHRIFTVDTGSTVSLRYLTFREGNPPTNAGGGGAIRNLGRLTVEKSSFVDNRAASGGAIGAYGVTPNRAGTLRLNQCTFARNEATALDGGAVDAYGLNAPLMFSMRSCSFDQNRARKRGGAVFYGKLPNVTEGFPSSFNSLIGHNPGGDGGSIVGVASEGYNLIQDTTGNRMFLLSNDIAGQPVLVDPIGDYGGPTPTLRLQANSPAIDASALPLLFNTDQRGFPRVFGGRPDIGAYEYDPATSIAEDFDTPRLRVYPNPTQRWITVEFPAERAKMVELSDAQGRIVRTYTIPAGLTSHKFDLAGLPSGVYFLRADAFSRKIVKR